MKLIGNLKENVEKAESKEQAMDIIANAGMELTDDELKQVTGGVYFDAPDERRPGGAKKGLS